MKIMKLVIFLLYIAHSLGFQVVFQNFKSVISPRIQSFTAKQTGPPLFLTPLLENGRIDEARKKARVQHSDMKGVESYSGYLTVNKDFNSNLFFWYFPSKGNPSTDPLILWLQGGPGVTSLFGLFTGNGPFIVTEKNTLEMRNMTWVNNHNIVYIDSPVGTGFSFTEDDLDYATNINDVAVDLYVALYQFFTLFPQLRKNEFYVMGESYGGKYVPAVSYVIHKANQNPKINRKINLVGLAIGNGWTDPINQLHYSEYLYQIGLIDENASQLMQKLENKVKNLIKQEQYVKAFYTHSILLGGDGNGNPGLFENYTGFENVYNYLQDKSPENLFPFADWLLQPSVIQALHVGNQEFTPLSSKVYRFLLDDNMRSIANVLAALLENYRVLIFYGQLDIICAYPMAENYLKQLRWSGAEEYKKAPRNLWKVGNELAGYKKIVRNLTEVLIRNAGHMVPSDQPLWAWTMISHFTRHKPL